MIRHNLAAIFWAMTLAASTLFPIMRKSMLTMTSPFQHQRGAHGSDVGFITNSRKRLEGTLASSDPLEGHPCKLHGQRAALPRHYNPQGLVIARCCRILTARCPTAGL